MQNSVLFNSINFIKLESFSSRQFAVPPTCVPKKIKWSFDIEKVSAVSIHTDQYNRKCGSIAERPLYVISGQERKSIKEEARFMPGANLHTYIVNPILWLAED